MVIYQQSHSHQYTGPRTRFAVANMISYIPEGSYWDLQVCLLQSSYQAPLTLCPIYMTLLSSPVPSLHSSSSCSEPHLIGCLQLTWSSLGTSPQGPGSCHYSSRPPDRPPLKMMLASNWEHCCFPGISTIDL